MFETDCGNCKFNKYYQKFIISYNCIRDLKVSVLVSSAVDRGLDPRSGQTKDYKINISCFSTKHAALRSKSKGWFSHNQNNVSKWCSISTSGQLCQ